MTAIVRHLIRYANRQESKYAIPHFPFSSAIRIPYATGALSSRYGRNPTAIGEIAYRRIIFSPYAWSICVTSRGLFYIYGEPGYLLVFRFPYGSSYLLFPAYLSFDHIPLMFPNVAPILHALHLHPCWRNPLPSLLSPSPRTVWYYLPDALSMAFPMWVAYIALRSNLDVLPYVPFLPNSSSVATPNAALTHSPNHLEQIHLFVRFRFECLLISPMEFASSLSLLSSFSPLVKSDIPFRSESYLFFLSPPIAKRSM